MSAERLNNLTKSKTNVHPVVNRATEATAEDFEDLGRVTDNHADILDALTGAASPNKNYGVFTTIALLEAAHPVGEANSYAIIDAGSGTTPQIATWNDVSNQWDLGAPNEYVIYSTNFASLPSPGVENKIYVTLDNFNLFTWKNGVYNNLNVNNPLLQLKSEKDKAFGYVGLNELLKFNPDYVPELPISRITSLQDFITNINQLLLSDDVSLDDLQEIVNYIKINKDDLANLSIPNIAGLQQVLDNLISKSIAKKYTDFNQLTSDNQNQKIDLIYFVSNASGHSLVQSGYAYFEYLGTTNGDETDYRLISKQIVPNNLEYKLLLKTNSQEVDWKIHFINPVQEINWFVIDNSNGVKIKEGKGIIEADLSSSSGDCSLYIEVDENGLGVTNFTSYYGDGKLTYFDFDIVPLLENFKLYNDVSQPLSLQGLPINIKEFLVHNGAIANLNFTSSLSLEKLTLSANSVNTLNLSNCVNLKHFSSTVDGITLNVSNHLLLEYLDFRDTVSTSLDNNINTTYLLNLKVLRVYNNQYYDLDLNTRDLSKLTALYIKANTIQGMSTLTSLLTFQIKSKTNDLSFTGLDIETLSIHELPNTVLDLKPLSNLKSVNLDYTGNNNLTDVLIDNTYNDKIISFRRRYVSQGQVINVKVDNPTDANNEVTPYLPTVWNKQYNGYDVLNFV